MKIMINSAAFWIAMSMAAPAAVGETIHFTWQGQVSGYLGGKPFPLTNYTITAYRDDPVVDFDPESGSVIWFSEPPRLVLEDRGEFDFLFDAFIYWTQFGPDRGVVGIEFPAYAMVFGPAHAGLLHWDMLSDIGPLTGIGGIGAASPYFTSGGAFFGDNILRPTTFTARVVPEPATASLFVFGAFAAAGALRRR